MSHIRLHHFTAAHCIAGIRAKGLTKGALPWNRAKDGTPQMLRNRLGPGIPGPGFQWLTRNADFFQPWCLLGELPFAKNAYRVTVFVPPNAQKQLYSWRDMCARCRPDCADEINTPQVDWDNWFVFYGTVPPSWIVEVVRNPGEQFAAGLMGAG